MADNNRFRIAFVSGKLGDVDGVSLEVDKWIQILQDAGHTIFTIAGYYPQALSGIPIENQLLLESIRFNSPGQMYFEKFFFPHLNDTPTYIVPERYRELESELLESGTDAGIRLFRMIQEHSIDVIIAENTNAMPMSLIGAVAIHRIASVNRLAVIFHHHDFWWERSRFSESTIDTLLNRIMPPKDPGLEHVVISSYACRILRSIKRIDPRVITNCEDYDSPVTRDDWSSDFRQQLGFRDDDILVIQPTRIVPRKRIEDSLKLLGLFMQKYPELADRIQFIISLYQGDEKDEKYTATITSLADSLGVPLHFISDRVAAQRGIDDEGRKIYTNRDVLTYADLAVYLPVWEGFGNAFLEAVSCRIPIVISTYLVYKTDIQVAGFRGPKIRDRYREDGSLIIPEKVLKKMYKILTDSDYRDEITRHNFEIGKKEFGFSTLKNNLNRLIDEYSHEILASRRRLRKSLTQYSV